jgi:citrate lyase alpha subunit
VLIQDIKAEVLHTCRGRPQPPKAGERQVAIFKWLDGTVLDTVWQTA